METLSLSSFHNTIKNLTDVTDINMDEVIRFTKRDVTEKSAKQYLQMMTELHNKIETLNSSQEEKNQFKSLFFFLLSKMCESDCKGQILNNVLIKNKKYKQMIDKMQNEWQNERDEFNKMAKKFNEKQKEDKVNVSGISLSITLKNDKKSLNPQECIDLLDEADLDEKEIDEKFKRISIPKEYKSKVSRAYVKASEKGNNIIQK